MEITKLSRILTAACLLSFATPVFAGNWGDMIWGNDVWGTDTPSTSTPPTGTGDGPITKVEFQGLKNFYDIGEKVELDLVESVETNRFERLDLWVAIELPGGQLFFKTSLPLTPFSDKPKVFKSSVEASDNTHRLLEFEVPKGMGGKYVFYAVYVEEGANPITQGFTTFRSNLAREEATLANE
jgi:hypothetical protein